MGEPLELSYDWRRPAVIAGMGAVLAIVSVIQSGHPGWPAAVGVILLILAAFGTVLWLRTRAYLRVAGHQLVVRRFRGFSTIAGRDVTAVAEYPTRQGPAYELTVREPDGPARRLVAPTALLRDGPSTLFAWILAEAPLAALDASSRRTVEVLRSKGLL